MERRGVMTLVNELLKMETERQFLRGAGFKPQGEDMVREQPLNAYVNKLHTYTQTHKPRSGI